MGQHKTYNKLIKSITNWLIIPKILIEWNTNWKDPKCLGLKNSILNFFKPSFSFLMFRLITKKLQWLWEKILSPIMLSMLKVSIWETWLWEFSQEKSVEGRREYLRVRYNFWRKIYKTSVWNGWKRKIELSLKESKKEKRDKHMMARSMILIID